jgi:proline dehydrogenase
MILRRLLLYLSTSKQLRRWVETSSTAKKLTSRFIAGQTLADALATATTLNNQHILVTLDHLGENVTSLDEARASRDAYFEALGAIRRLGLPATVSIKLTQFGLDLSETCCRENVAALVEKAHQAGSVVEVDMESASYVDRTLAVLTDLHERHASVRAVIQAYLYRSEADIEMLCAKGIPVRLCKGAYREPPSIAYPRKQQVDQNYLRLARILLMRGVDPGFATHDPKMVAAALRYSQEHGVPPDRFEFQMLYGIRRDLQRRLVARGFRLRLYIPYGNAWYPYFMRRLAERPANLLFLARNVFRG